MFKLINGDCLEELKKLSDNSVDAVVTDPPYGLSNHAQQDIIECLTSWLAGKEYKPNKKGYMGHSWDAWVPGPEVWKECLRILKPGGHLVAFAGTRSMDLMYMSVRLAGFELRDSIGNATDNNQAALLAWVNGSGMPKSQNISKMMDKKAGATRTVVGKYTPPNGKEWNLKQASVDVGIVEDHASGVFTSSGTRTLDVTEPATELAKTWSGWGTALKPAWEPIILARKPISESTIISNVSKHGVGGINIDACRIQTDENLSGGAYSETPTLRHDGDESFRYKNGGASYVQPTGRWPANVVHDGSDSVESNFPVAGNGWNKDYGSQYQSEERQYKGGVHGGGGYANGNNTYTDSGTASRFFYCSKAANKDRDEGMDDFKVDETALSEGRKNNHPTVKPNELMKWLCKLVCPPGGVILDPFMGSGSTGKAAVQLGFSFVGIEQNIEYVKISDARISDATLVKSTSLFD